MASRADKEANNKVEHVFDSVHEENRHDPKIALSSTTLAEALLADKPKLMSENMMKLYGILVIGYMIATMNGFGTVDCRLQLDSKRNHG
jgi:uncharacterized membrane protein